MCKTCNWKSYPNQERRYYEDELGYGSLRIRYYFREKEYKLAVANEERSEFYIYKCPTCGKKLY